MNRSRMWLALWATTVFALTAVSAPAPAPTPVSQGPISDFLRLRGKLPHSPAPHVMRVQGGEETLEVDRRVMAYRQEVRETTVKRGEREEKVQYTVMVPVATFQKEKVAIKDCKFFTVTRDRKLEAVEVKKAATLLKKAKAVLTGESTEVDPRHLELVKPGTLYLVVPPPQPPMPLPDRPPERRP